MGKIIYYIFVLVITSILTETGSNIIDVIKNRVNSLLIKIVYLSINKLYLWFIDVVKQDNVWPFDKNLDDDYYEEDYEEEYYTEDGIFFAKTSFC